MGEDKKAFSSLLKWIKSGTKHKVQEEEEAEEANAKMDLLSRGEEPETVQKSETSIRVNDYDEYESSYSKYDDRYGMNRF